MAVAKEREEKNVEDGEEYKAEVIPFPKEHKNKKMKQTSFISDDTKRKFIRNIPMTTVTILLLTTLYFTLYSCVKVYSLLMSHYIGERYYLLPMLFFKFENTHLWFVFLTAIVSIYGWLLSTRIERYRKSKWRVLIFWNMFIGIAANICGYGMSKIQTEFLPFFYARVDRVIETSDTVNMVLFGQLQGFYFTVMLTPLILFAFMGMFLMSKYRRHDKDIVEKFYEFKWTGERLRKFENLSKIEDNIVELPIIELGINKKTEEMVSIPGNDRTLNTIIVGSIGTGKSAALGLPILFQDLKYMVKFMNALPTIHSRPDFISEKVLGRFLNGITVIEPSNDFCKKVYALAKAYGIPDEAITYIDPTNPNTPSINVISGPVDKAAETMAQVMAGLADNGGGGGNFFFIQAERNHLKQFIYLLKLHDPEKTVGFEDLILMYSDNNLVHDMHMKLKRQITNEYGDGSGIDRIKERDRYNFYNILVNLDKWFDNVIVAKEERTPQGTQKVRNDDGDFVYIDTKEMQVQGLRNVLNDIGNNPLLARVLYGHSDFDFDKHMGPQGGILLVNTAKGELDGLSPVLGKLVLMNIQNAAFRRPPNVSAFHHVVIDEAPEYLYSNFATFPTQSRKYKVILSTLLQSLTQLKDAFGEDYMNTIVTAMRNRMVYADVSNFDSEYFSKMFGEIEVYEEMEQENAVSAIQDNPMSRSGASYSKTLKPIMTSSNIQFQDAFECAVKIVVDNKSLMAQQIRANFVPQEYFERNDFKVDEIVTKSGLKSFIPEEFIELAVEVDSQAANTWVTVNEQSSSDEEIVLEDMETALNDSLAKEDVGATVIQSQQTESELELENQNVQNEVKKASETATKIEQPSYPKQVPTFVVPNARASKPINPPISKDVNFHANEGDVLLKQRKPMPTETEPLTPPIEVVMPQKTVELVGQNSSTSNLSVGGKQPPVTLESQALNEVKVHAKKPIHKLIDDEPTTNTNQINTADVVADYKASEPTEETTPVLKEVELPKKEVVTVVDHKQSIPETIQNSGEMAASTVVVDEVTKTAQVEATKVTTATEETPKPKRRSSLAASVNFTDDTLNSKVEDFVKEMKKSALEEK